MRKLLFCVGAILLTALQTGKAENSALLEIEQTLRNIQPDLFKQPSKQPAPTAPEAKVTLEVEKPNHGLCVSPSFDPTDPALKHFLGGFLTDELDAGIGFNSNVNTVSKGFPIPPGVARKGTSYEEIEPKFSVDWYLPHSSASDALWDRITFKYDGIFDTYERLSKSNRLTQSFSEEYCHAFTQRFSGSLGVNDLWIRIDNRNFANLFGVGPTFKLAPTDWVLLALGYVYSPQHFYVPGNQFTRQDSDNHVASLTATYSLMTSLQITSTYFHEWNLAEGSDNSYNRDAIGATVSYTAFTASEKTNPLQKVTIAAGYEHRFDRYTHLNSKAGDLGFEFERRDDLNTSKAILDVQFRGGLHWITQYIYVFRDSNIPASEYDRNVILSKIAFAF